METAAPPAWCLTMEAREIRPHHPPHSSARDGDLICRGGRLSGKSSGHSHVWRGEDDFASEIVQIRGHDLRTHHFYVEEGLPKKRVLLWVSGEPLRATFDNVVLAEYRCRYDWQDGKVKEIREGVFYPTCFASPQGMLIPLTPQDSLVVYRSKPPRLRVPSPAPVRQLLLFELVNPSW